MDKSPVYIISYHVYAIIYLFIFDFSALIKRSRFYSKIL